MAGTIPFYKVGKYNRFNLDELDQHLAENCRRGPLLEDIATEQIG